MTHRKDTEQVVTAAEKQGWRAVKTRGGHWKLYAPDGEHIVVAAGTPSSASSVRKTVALLKRHGYSDKEL